MYYKHHLSSHFVTHVNVILYVGPFLLFQIELLNSEAVMAEAEENFLQDQEWFSSLANICIMRDTENTQTIKKAGGTFKMD